MKWLLVVLVLVASVAAANTLPEMNVVVFPDIPNTLFTYNFVFSDTSSCNVLLNISADITTNAVGRGNATLNTTGLLVTPAYLCTYRAGTLVNKQSLNPRAFEEGNVTTTNGIAGYIPIFSSATNIVSWMLGSQVLNSTGFDAGNITSGTIPDARIASAATWNAKGNSNLTLTQIMTNIGNWSGNQSFYSTTTIANTLYMKLAGADASNITTGTFADARIASASVWNNKGSSNLTLSDVVAGVGNYSADKSIDGLNITGRITASNGMYDYAWVEGAHSQTYFCDFMTPSATTMCYPNYIGAALTGSAPAIAGSKTTPGVVNITSTVATNTGYYFMTGVTAFLISGGEDFKSQIYLPSVPVGNTSRVRIGFGDSITVAAQIVDGVYWDINSTNAGIVGTPVVVSNSVAAFGATYTFTGNSWHTVRVVVNATATGSDFYVYDNTGVEVYHNWVTATHPTAAGRQTGAGIVATVTSAGLARGVVAVDYLSTQIDQTRRFG